MPPFLRAFLAIGLLLAAVPGRADSQFGSASGVLSIGGKRGNITVLPPSALPAPTANSAGGVMAGSAPTHQFLTGIGSNGAPVFAQPAIGDVIPGDVSAMSVLTPGNIASAATSVGSGSAVPLSTLLNATYGFATGNDAPGLTYPKPLFLHAPVVSEYLTHSGPYTHIVDNPSEANRVFAHSFTYEASTGGSASVGDLSGERVDVYFGMRGLPGAGSIWAANFNTQLQTGYTGPGASVAEFDLTNSAQHRGDGFGQVPYTSQNSSALSINTLSTYRNAEGVFIDGKLLDGTPAWNRGYVVYAGAVNASWGCAFCDYGGSYASLQSYGSHTIGIDFTNATNSSAAIALGMNQGNSIAFWNAGAAVERIFGTTDGQLVFTATKLTFNTLPIITTATGGGAGAPPTTVAAYIKVNIQGVDREIALYNP